MKVLFLDEVHEVLAQRLSQAGFECHFAFTENLETCKVLTKDVDGLVIRSRFRMDASFLDNAKNLKFIARSGAGMENIDEAYCEDRNIYLFNAPEGNRNAVGEHALGMLLALFNNLTAGDHQIRNGQWNREENRGVELDGKNIGIIGYGNNGTAFAKKLKGFDVKVFAYDKYKEGFDSEWVRESSMNDVYLNSDVLSLHIPQTKETLSLIDEDFINSMQKPFYLINLSRGKIVETNALVSGLKSGKILGACLDVLEYEKSSFESFFGQELPEAFKYLLSSNRVILSPHVGGWTVESYFKLSDVLADKILTWHHTKNSAL
jgi:D-3-phosphoglycerate dehydrogenase